jgi:hypothetical protein
MFRKQAKNRVWLLALAVLVLALVTLACGETASPTTEATAVPEATEAPKPTDTPTPKPTNIPTTEPTNTPEPKPTSTPEPTNTPEATLEPFPSGGLGLSKAEWEQEHIEDDTSDMFTNYDGGKYSVTFVDDKIQYLERVFTDGQPTLDVARSEAQTLIPEDSQFLETYSPEGLPELIVDLYISESLGERSESDWVWFDSEIGTFIAIYGVFDGRVTRMIIATGNNP